MSGMIEVTKSGQALYAGSRELPWHRLGTTVDADLSAPDALRLALMTGWDVRTVPLTVMTEDGMYPMPRHRLIVRNNPETGEPEPIAPTGNTYVPVQNEELADFAAAILDNSDLVMDACGSLDGGRRVFLTLRSPESVKYGPNEVVTPYLLVASGHDASLSTIVRPTWVRVVCQNTLSAALSRRSVTEFRVRHTSTIEGRIQDARTALGVQHAGQTALDEEIARLLATPFTATQWQKAVDLIAPLDPDLSKGGTTRREKARDELWSLWSASTQDVSKGTAWAATQAVGEWYDWYGVGADNADKRARRGLFSTLAAKAKADATAKVLSLV